MQLAGLQDQRDDSEAQISHERSKTGAVRLEAERLAVAAEDLQQQLKVAREATAAAEEQHKEDVRKLRDELAALRRSSETRVSEQQSAQSVPQSPEGRLPIDF